MSRTTPFRPVLTRRALLPLAAGAALAPAAAWAFPDRQMTMITGYAPGGSTDLAARLLAEEMPRHMGVGGRMVVENRPGAAGTVASEWLTRQPADGHTLMLTETGAALAAPVVRVGGTPYHPINDFTHLGFISRPPAVLVVTPSLAADNPAETLARLRAHAPGVLTYASSGVGGMIHIWGEMVSRALGVQAVHVPYRSGAQMTQSIMTGETQFGVAAMASAVPLLRQGSIRAVGLIGNARFAPMPEVPTLGELGMDGFDTGSLFMLVGPAGIPDAVAEVINRALQAALADATVAERMLNAGLPPAPPPNGLSDARALMVDQYGRLQAVVAETGIRIEN